MPFFLCEIKLILYFFFYQTSKKSQFMKWKQRFAFLVIEKIRVLLQKSDKILDIFILVYYSSRQASFDPKLFINSPQLWQLPGERWIQPDTWKKATGKCTAIKEMASMYRTGAANQKIFLARQVRPLLERANIQEILFWKGFN